MTQTRDPCGAATPTRRAALAASAALALGAAPAAAGTQADGEVIRLAAEMERHEAAKAATFYPPAATIEEEEAREPERDRLSELIDDAADTLATTRARTLPGLIAKARAAYVLADKTDDGELQCRDSSDMLALSLVEDVVALGGPPPAHVPPPPSPPGPPWAPPAWQVKAEAEGERLRALGLHRVNGFVAGDAELLGWLLRRIADDMGEATAQRVLALSCMDPTTFGPNFTVPWRRAL